MAVVFGLLVAVCYGAGDFLGGVASKRQSPITVVVASQAAGLVLVLGLLAVGGGSPTGRDVGIGAGAGLVGLVGVLLLYRGLAVGRMGVVAPVTAVGAAVLPLAAGLLGGERPSGLALLGVLGALVAVFLVARSPGGTAETTPGAELLLALAAGAAFGLVFIALDATGDDAGAWPLLGARGTSVTLLTVVALAYRVPLAPVTGTAAVVVGAGFLDVAANALYLLATREGLLSLVSVLSSLYPAGTVLLARVVLAERLVRPQVVGIGIGLAGIALIAAG